MVETLEPPRVPIDRQPARPRRRRLGVPLAIGAAVALVAGIVLVRDVIETSSDRPHFPSLAETPDPSLQGTVAYFEGSSRCVWIVAAAGQPSKEVLCLPPVDVGKPAEVGTKETDPQLVWRADGRLEVTVFRAAMGKGAPPSFRAGWQKVVDVRSGVVEDVPAADVPSALNVTTRPTVSPDGRRLTTTSDPESGRVEVTLTDANGTRTLLSAHGPGNYTYGLDAAFWAPNWQWVAAFDGRILVITTGDQPVTRVLTDRESSSGNAMDERFSTFAVTDANLLTPSG